MNIEFVTKPCAICGNDARFKELVVCKDRRIHREVRTVVCADCGLVFLNPGPTENAYVTFYGETMGAGAPPPPREDLVRKKRILAPLQIRFIADNLGDLSQKEAVDVGSGWGAFLSYLKPQVKSLVSIEVFGPAKAYIEREFQCRVCPVARLRDAFPPASFDLITSTAVIEHYPEPMDAVLDYARALRPGGALFVFTSDIKGMCFSTGIDQYFKFVHPYYYSVNTLQSLLSKAGFGDFVHWTSRPDYSVRSVRNPASLEPGDIFLMARKLDHPPRENLLCRDSAEDIKRIFQTQAAVEQAFQRRRALWLSPWAIPLRAVGRLLPRHRLDKYAPVAAQYSSRHDQAKKKGRKG